jgi:hypothetical protein
MVDEADADSLRPVRLVEPAVVGSDPEIPASRTPEMSRTSLVLLVELELLGAVA